MDANKGETDRNLLTVE